MSSGSPFFILKYRLAIPFESVLPNSMSMLSKPQLKLFILTASSSFSILLIICIKSRIITGEIVQIALNIPFITTLLPRYSPFIVIPFNFRMTCPIPVYVLTAHFSKTLGY